MSQVLQESDLAFALQRASQAMSLVYREGRSLDQAIYHVLHGVETAQARGAIQDLSYFGMRHLGRGLVLARLLSNKQELNPKSLTELLALALALLWPTESPKYTAHTVVNQTVNACAAHAVFKRAKGLVNACLRSFLRDLPGWSQKALEYPEAEFNMPRWWLNQVRSQHPEHWPVLCAQAQMQPPLVLRVNARWGSPAQYVQRAQAEGLAARVVGPQAVWIEKAVGVDRLPGFEAGHVSVQDCAAQLAAPLLGLEQGQRVLDACAAPGGKSSHLLESANIDLLALDISEARLSRVYDNVDRVAATLLPLGAWSFAAKVAPVQAIKQWWDGQPFDAILADVPCSGSGVVRRHPDIPWLRREDDVANLSHIQHEILTALWSTLRPGGKLLLATCSIFREEGPLLSKRFEEQHADAVRLPAPGWVLPHPMAGVDELAASPDGFFYALFQKRLVS